MNFIKLETRQQWKWLKYNTFTESFQWWKLAVENKLTTTIIHVHTLITISLLFGVYSRLHQEAGRKMYPGIREQVYQKVVENIVDEVDDYSASL